MKFLIIKVMKCEREGERDLFLEQWHRPEEEAAPHLPDPKLSELHFLLREEVERGGFPAEETWERLII